MSLEHEELFMDRLPKGDIPKSKEEKEFEKILNEKLEKMTERNRMYLEDLFKALRSTPVNIKNAQVTNSQGFRDGFVSSQLNPLLGLRLTTLEEFLTNIESVSRNFTKLNLVENMVVSLNSLPKGLFGSRDPTSIDLVPVFNIIPSKKFYAKTGTNIGNGEGDGYIQFQFKNLFGGAENLIFDAITGTKTQSSYLVNYNQPILNNANYIFENSAFMNTRKMDHLQSEANVKGISTKLYTQFDSPVNHELVFENCWKILRNMNSRSTDVLSQAGSNIKSSLIYNWKFDSRDNQHLPLNGSLYRLGLEYNGWFKFNKSPFMKVVLESQNTMKLNKHHSFILTNKSGLLLPFNGQSYVLDRFYVGGPNDVRSFLLNGIGPKQYGSSVGGDVFLKGGISLVSKFPRVSEDSNFKLHSFINYGKLILYDKSKTAFELVRQLTSEHSVGCGFGILYNHPMARFELNFVLPIAIHERDGIRKGLQYGIGLTFL
ncbi:uncharacterized protein PRCAT00005221001 [Priceomyces carsonii]|uniref:uncharacterized protein n=1 Tax=Priceomyces carsonii TaxID=28549 RepID=UPI002ED98C27|nr:unnamed protein product [Priceomyces carsonii]